MKNIDYVKLALETGDAIYELMERECDRILGYHSYSPQYDFYRKSLLISMNRCIYSGHIQTRDYEFIMDRFNKHKDTNTLNVVSPVLYLLGRYKPRLKLIDLLYDIDLPRTYILRSVSKEMNSVFKCFDSFGSLYQGRQSLIIDHLAKAYETLNSPNRECYYYLSLAKNALLIFTKYYREGEADELVNLYIDICKEVYEIDKEFYEEFNNSFYDDLSDSSVFSSNASQPRYSYLEFLGDMNDAFKSLSSNKYFSIVGKLTTKVLTSGMPQGLCELCVKSLSDLEISYTAETCDISSCFVWYDIVQNDFVYYLGLKNFNESKTVVNTFDNILTEDELVHFYVNKAMMSSLPDGGDDLAYNVALINSLENLESYDFISDVSHYFNLYRR